MNRPVHASCVAIGGRGVLLSGRSGAGKSDLALRLIDRGAVLVSDDYTHLRVAGTRLVASPPATIAGRMEVRGIGIVHVTHLPEVDIALFVDLDEAPARMPDRESRMLEGVAIPLVRFAALEPSAPVKVEWALERLA